MIIIDNKEATPYVGDKKCVAVYLGDKLVWKKE